MERPFVYTLYIYNVDKITSKYIRYTRQRKPTPLASTRGSGTFRHLGQAEYIDQRLPHLGQTGASQHHLGAIDTPRPGKVYRPEVVPPLTKGGLVSTP